MRYKLAFILALICSVASADTWILSSAKTGDSLTTKNPDKTVEWCNQFYATDDCVKRTVIEPTQAEMDAIEAESKKKDELDELDRKSIRSLRAVLSAQAEGKQPEQTDINTLKSLEAQAKTIRGRK